MQTDQSSDVKFEIGHVLFIDIVGYSKLLINEQSEQLQKLKEIVRGTEQFRLAETAGKLLRLPTGDGGALVFRNSEEAPLLCAIEISQALKKYPGLRVRMGIHSGPVNEVTDLNEQANIAGAGINIAQRVMDCGDAGHIVLSKHIAEDLEHYPRWQPYLHDLGECEVKHVQKISVVNFYNDEVGNAEMPEKFANTLAVARAKTDAVHSGVCLRRWIIGILIGTALVFGALVFLKHRRESANAAFNRMANQPAPAAVAAPEKSVAVLPFQNLSSDKENAYFAEGIQDEILTRLSKIAALKVISRTSTQKYKSTPDNLREVGRQLGVANLLEGSVQRIANAVHVNVQLIRAATDEHVWAESYNRKLDDVFGVEGEVAAAIADQLNARLTGAEEKALTDKPTQNAAAYEAYLRAISLEAAGKDVRASQEIAAADAEAVRLDPKFALAWARLALARSFLYFNGVDPAVNSGDAVKEAADRALVLQPELGEAWVAQGVYRYRVLRDFPAALQSYAEALKRLPNSALVFEQMAHVERRLGKWDLAEKHYQSAAQLDPRNLEVLSNLPDIYSTLRRFDEVEAAYDRILQVAPGNEAVLANKAFFLQFEGRLNDSAKELSKIAPDSQNDNVVLVRYLQFFYERRFDDAIAYLEKSSASVLKDPRTITVIGFCQEWLGRKDEARATFNRAIATMKPQNDSVVPVDARELPCYLAWDYAGLGDKEKALQQARKAIGDYESDFLCKPFAEQTLAQIQARFGDADSAIAALPHLLEVPNGITRGSLRVDPFWDPLHKDPRFQKLSQEQQK
jgi:TolB-like protein/Tfp pilus assembly protein PilF